MEDSKIIIFTKLILGYLNFVFFIINFTKKSKSFTKFL